MPAGRSSQDRYPAGRPRAERGNRRGMKQTKKNRARRRNACLIAKAEEHVPDSDLSCASAFRESKLILFFRRISLSHRLNMAGILLSLVPLLIVGIASYTRGSRTITNMAQRLVTQAITQTAKVISSKLQVIINDGVEITYSDLVQNSLPLYDSMTGLEKMRLAQALQESINRKYIYNSYDCEIMLYTLDRTEIYAYGPQYFRFHLADEHVTQLLDRARDLWGKPLWQVMDETWEEHVANKENINRASLLLIRAIKSLDTGGIIGYLMIRMDVSEISELLGEINVSADTRLLVLSDENIIIASDPSYTPATVYPDPLLPEQLAANPDQPFFYSDGNRRYMVAHATTTQGRWSVIMLTPESTLTEEPRSLLYTTLLVIFLCGVAGLALFSLVSASITRPVRSLQTGIKNFSENTDIPPLPETGQDEITHLTHQFNDMTEKITMLIDNVSRHEQEKHELETKALQAQINPHFLANTLDTVIYMAHIKDEKNIEEILRAIVNILNNCKRNDSSMTTVRSALDFLRSYEMVQSYRMLGRFKLTYEIDEDLYDCRLPRFILQPIVENALIHGIEPSGHAGRILLKGYRKDGSLCFSVTDNGVGMTEDQIGAMFQNTENEKRQLTGIGMANVQRRLQLIYGPNYGLHIISVPGEYTTVEVLLPLEHIGKEGSGHDPDPAGR